MSGVEMQRFEKGDRVQLHGEDLDKGYEGYRGVVARQPRYKRPHGRHIGWWYWIRIDPPPGIKKFMAEVSERCLRPEPESEDRP